VTELHLQISPWREIPTWAQLLLGGCLLVSGVVLVLFVRRNRNPSFLRDFILLLGLALPLLGGALLLAILVPPDSPERVHGRLALLLATWALSVYAMMRFSVTALRWWAEQSEPIKASQVTLARIVRLLILMLGLLVFLDILKVPITPLLTTLGIGSLAIALALQDTLTNFFAGLYIAADRPLYEGDYIKLNSGEEGVVLRVGWRTTQLRSPADNIVIVPNAKVAQASITNFDLGDRRLAISIRIPVAYGQDPRRITQVLQAVLHGAVGQVPGLLDTPAPTASFDPGFGDRALEFTMSCHVLSRDYETSVKSDLRQRAAQHLTQEHIALISPPQA
jgi:small-conductance mechanosensitive channel